MIFAGDIELDNSYQGRIQDLKLGVAQMEWGSGVWGGWGGGVYFNYDIQIRFLLQYCILRTLYNIVLKHLIWKTIRGGAPGARPSKSALAYHFFTCYF